MRIIAHNMRIVKEVQMQSALSQKISLLLKQKNLTISEFEKNAGLGKSAVSNIIHGRSKNPSIDIISTIAKKLGCTIEYLILDPSPHEQTFASSKGIDYRLCAEATSRLAEHLLSCNITSMSQSDFFKCAREVYDFAKESGQPFIDVRFIKWSVRRFFLKEEEVES
jgi:transcriptional regulator with XRE-family HTH domain